MYASIPRLKNHRVRSAHLSNVEGDAPLAAGKTAVLLDVQGAGQISRLHVTIGHYEPSRFSDPDLYRKVVIRIFWDGETSPSVLAPLGDFFCDAFGGTGTQFSTPFFANHGGHLVCYLPMPFARGCRIELENQGEVDDGIIACDVLYEEWDSCPDDLGRLHAAWRRENPTVPGRAYTVLEATGRGHYIGCNLSVQTYGRPTLGFLEGLADIRVDDDPDPAYKLWGTEDYFGGSFYFARGAFVGPYAGCTVLLPEIGRFAGYRLHLPDAIPFHRSISVRINHGDSLESGPFGEYDGEADYSSVAYWYQVEPHDPAGYQGHAVSERVRTTLAISPSTESGWHTPEWARRLSKSSD